MTGASTIQPNDVRSLLRSFIVPFHEYEAQWRFRNVSDQIHYESLDLCWGKWDIDFISLNYLLVDHGLSLTMRARMTPDRVFEMYYSQRLLGFIIRKYLDRLDNRNYSLPSLDPSGQLLVLWAVRLAGTTYRVSGRRGEAISLLETVIHMVEQELDLKGAIIWFFYNKMLIELAHCCAEDGHRDEARHLLNNKIIVPSRFERMADRRFSPFSGPLTGMFLCKLRRSRREALQLVRELKNGRVGTHITQKHHARPQVGSCQPGTSEWGPFLTDRIEWDKI